MSKSKKRTASTIVFMLVFSIVVIAVFYIIKTRTSPINTIPITSMTEVEKLIAKDIPNNYPSSPREVLKLYSRITKSLYNEDLKEEQINKLADQMRYIYDEELLSNKTQETYLLDLKVEIAGFHKVTRMIMSYAIEKSSSVIYWDIEGKEYASIVVAFTLKQNSDYSKVMEKFILRKDEKSKWKILGWELSDKTDIESEE